jgi:LPXTG-motif cell wall-anchored protein
MVIIMIKKLIAIAVSLITVLSMSAVMAFAAEVDDVNVGADSNSAAGADTSSSTTGAGNVLNFDAGTWKNFSEVYCHIWKRGGDPFYPWQTKKEKCKGSGKNWSYDISALDIKPEEDYCVIFSTNIGQQTYDATFSKSCVGDTLKLTGKKIENPKDSEKTADEAVWTKNSSSYGPHLAFTSIGNIVGSKLCPHEKGVEVIGDWLPTYYKSNYIKDKVAALVKAYKKFSITSANQIQDIYAYILNKKTGEDEATMKKMLEDAFAKAYPAKKNEAKIDTQKAKQEAQQISSNGGHVSSGSGSASASSGSSSYSGGSTSTNSSGSGPDGEEDTILFILAGIIILAGGVMFTTRRRVKE